MTYVRMADAAFAANIPPGFGIVGGYYGGPNAYHVWPEADWDRFPGFKLPIWVGGTDGAGEGVQAGNALRALLVPAGCVTVLDLETRGDAESAAYAGQFGGALEAFGYKTWVYGSASTVFRNPPLNGYWVADYTTDIGVIDDLLQHPGVRAVQFAALGLYDVSLVKQWVEGEMWHG